MIEDKILYGFLDRLTQESLKEIQDGGSLNQQNALPFLIKEQYSKISRIEEEFSTREDLHDFKQYVVERFDQVDKKFMDIDKRFIEVEKKFEDKLKVIYWVMGIGFTANLSLSLTILTLLLTK